MINTKKALAIVKQYFPKMSDQQLMLKIEAFAKEHPNLTDEQAMISFQQALKHPNVSGKFSQPHGLQLQQGAPQVPLQTNSLASYLQR